MARAWFYNIPMHGHVNPTLPFVRELVRRGDDVKYFAGPQFEEKIAATGAAYGDYGDAYSFEGSRAEAHAILQGSQLAEATNALLPGAIEAVERDRPDYIVFDMSAAWANIVAQRYSIPCVASFPHLPFHWRAYFDDKRLLAKGLHSLRPGRGYYRDLQHHLVNLATEHNLRKPSEINVLSSEAELNIVFSTRYFQPHEDRFDASYEFIGPVLHTDRTDDPWPIERQSGRPLIYIAVGTLYKADLSFFRACIEAFGGEEFTVIMSVGKAVDPDDLGHVPDNIAVAQYVPQLQILDEADVFVTHGGMNSMNEAVMAMVPMVVVPNTVEQAANAVRLEQLHGGVFLEPRAVSDETLVKAVEQVRGDSGIKSGLERIRDSFASAGGVEAGVAAIERFKAQHGLE